MDKNPGYQVETKTGYIGRTFHKDGLVNGKHKVYIPREGKEDLKMLCDPSKLKIIGFID